MNNETDSLRAVLAARLKEECVRLGLTPELLANASGVHRSTAFTYLSGQRAPDAVFLSTASTRAGIDVQYVLTGRRERDAVPLPARDRASLDRLADLPPKVRQTVEDVLLLAWLAADSRRQYHAGDAETTYATTEPVAALVLHEPPPRRRAPVKKHV